MQNVSLKATHQPELKMALSQLARSFLVTFLLPALLLGCMVAIFYNEESNNLVTAMKLKQVNRLQNQKELINSYIQAIATDVLTVSKHYELIMMVDRNEERYRTPLAAEFLWLSKIKKIYDQVRYLDEKGMEVLRVNFNSGKPSIVALDQMQFKGERYYFKDTIQLKEGEVYVSPFDLNIEHGKIEMPLKPMIRFGTPVFDSRGKKRGVVILNYLGIHLLNTLDVISRDGVGDVMLLNSEGYFIRGPNQAEEWGFMYENKKNRTLANSHPQVWRRIIQAESGQFALEDGIYTFTTIRPFTEAQISSTGSGKPYTPSLKFFEGTKYCWKLVSHIPPEAVHRGDRSYLTRLIIIYATLLIILAFGSSFMAYTSTRRRQSEEEVRSHRDLLKQQVKERTIELTKVNEQLKKDIDKRKLVEAERNQLLDTMTARVRELRCTYSVTESIRKRRPLSELFRNVVSLIPSGWRHSENAAARLRFDDQTFVSQPFSETKWFQHADIVVSGRLAGVVEVFYLKAYSDVDEGPFTKEERNLINSIATVLGRTIEYRKAEEALRESEEKYRSMMEAMDDAVYICSKDFRIVYMNSAMINMVGYNAVGKKCHEVIHELDHTCSWCVHERVMDGQHVNTTVVSPRNHKHYLVSNSPIFHTDGSVSKLTIFRDNTEFRKMEAQLQQAQKMESVGRLAGGVAHDYNNALSVIIGFTEMAMDGLASEHPLRDYLSEILKAASNASDITRQLLAFARKQTIMPRMLNLNSTIENMLKMLRRLIGEDIDLVWRPGLNIWHVKTDPSQINQILANLCVNARDAINSVGKITIETKNKIIDEADAPRLAGLSPGNFVNLTVSDTGSGIENEILDNIFEPFFTTKGVDKGTGLGLATVYGIVKQNHGFINVYSEPRHGTTFSIYLPRHEGEVEDIRDTAVEVSTNAKGETVLLVEDDESILKLAKQILDKLGYTTLTASSPGAALQLSSKYKGPIHLLITDVIMPEMNGRELAEKIQSFYPDIKQVFMSGYTADVIAHSCVLDEDVHFIHKPFSKKDLATAVRNALNYRELSLNEFE